MNFVKMHGLGNDFVIAEAASWDAAMDLQSYARAVCDRNIGVGADGLVVIGKEQDMDIFMRIFNPDGSEPEMCGNAIRCVSKYVYEHKWVANTSFSVRTLAGPRYPVVKIRDGLVESVTVDMGEPILTRNLVPMTGIGDTVKVKANITGGEFELTGVSMGNPHCIIFVNDIGQTPISTWGPALETHELFPAKTNVEFVQVISRNELIMRVWERGAGMTLACGTGACATLVAANLNNHSDRCATIHLLGGDLYIEWKEQDNHIYMTGPATEVFSGQIDLDKL